MSFPVNSIRAIDLSDDQKSELTSTLAKCNASLYRAAFENYDKPRIKRLRDDFKSGEITLRYNPEARNALLEIISLESKVLAAYIKMCNELCAAFHHSHPELQSTIGYTDYLQEAAWAIYDATYTYNGSTEFSTYCYRCVKNQLITFVRKQRSLVGVTTKLAMLRTMARKLMREEQITLSEAIDKMICSEALKPKDEKALRRAMSKNYNLDEEYIENVPVSPTMDEETPIMWKAIEQSQLNPLERELIEAHLTSKRDLRRTISETRINPNTGKLYTKAVLSNVYLAACAKLRQTFEDLRKAA
jgi:DNA-directed RNA polymerase specialized sigma subunit